MTMRRVAIISDLHCGHRSGLTPPQWQYGEDSEGERGYYRDIQRACWDWYQQQIERWAPINVVICNGDAIDGKGERSGSTEQITADREEQVEIAAACIQAIGASRVIMSFGTPYHTGAEEDFERMLARRVNAEIRSHPFPSAEGVTFDVKHKVGASQIPHGRHTSTARERLWNLVWNERGLQPKAKVLVRSHVHYFQYAGDARGVALTTPALQAWTKYGGRQCAGTIDYGFLIFDCEDGTFTWTPLLMDLRPFAQEPIEV